MFWYFWVCVCVCVGGGTNSFLLNILAQCTCSVHVSHEAPPPPLPQRFQMTMGEGEGDSWQGAHIWRLSGRYGPLVGTGALHHLLVSDAPHVPDPNLPHPRRHTHHISRLPSIRHDAGHLRGFMLLLGLQVISYR